MADAHHAFSEQLPSMVRKPRAVWPGLVKMGMYQKQIAGDGNCLFASLSDQLYGTPAKHPEIRANIIEHMRTFRPLFEHYVHKDDVQQRRTLRSASLSLRPEPDDAFEEYLHLMSRTGTYGGEPELVAFCQVYNQDVIVHLPRIQNFDRDSISYRNEHRETPAANAPLHICYGGDEVTRAHYDSARSRDGSTPRSQDSPLLKPQDYARSSLAGSFPPSPGFLLSTRSIRNSRSELSSELLQDLLRNRRDSENTLDALGDKYRARSPSVTSSQRSSSSKRSLEDDGEPTRSTKRADRRKSTRRRAEIAPTLSDPDNELSPRLPIDSPHADTPPSTQDTEVSSDLACPEGDLGLGASAPVAVEDRTDPYDTLSRAPKPHTRNQVRSSLSLDSSNAQGPQSPQGPRVMSVTERPKSLRA